MYGTRSDNPSVFRSASFSLLLLFFAAFQISLSHLELSCSFFFFFFNPLAAALCIFCCSLSCNARSVHLIDSASHSRCCCVCLTLVALLCIWM